jgi:hypothetical protein
MTTRERWTVYPLLLLAIGLAVRGNIDAPSRVSMVTAAGVTADAIVCKELAIVTADGKIVVHAGRVKDGGGGRIEIRDAVGHDSLGLGTSPESRDGAVDFYDAEGQRFFRFGPRPSPSPEIPQ